MDPERDIHRRMDVGRSEPEGIPATGQELCGDRRSSRSNRERMPTLTIRESICERGRVEGREHPDGGVETV